MQSGKNVCKVPPPSIWRLYPLPYLLIFTSQNWRSRLAEMCLDSSTCNCYSSHYPIFRVRCFRWSTAIRVRLLPIAEAPSDTKVQQMLDFHFLSIVLDRRDCLLLPFHLWKQINQKLTFFCHFLSFNQGENTISPFIVENKKFFFYFVTISNAGTTSYLLIKLNYDCLWTIETHINN